jgi:hypothetical protein
MSLTSYRAAPPRVEAGVKGRVVAGARLAGAALGWRAVLAGLAATYSSTP